MKMKQKLTERAGACPLDLPMLTKLKIKNLVPMFPSV